MGLVTQLNLTHYLCNNVSISFAFIDQHGTVSEYSPPINMVITGGTYN